MGARSGGGGGGYSSFEGRIAGKIQLQGIGKVDAVRAGDLRVGDRIAWNFGYSSKVVAIGKSTPKGRYITTQSESGKKYTKLYSNNRLMGVKQTGK